MRGLGVEKTVEVEDTYTELKILSVGTDANGAWADVEVESYSWSFCPKSVVVARSASGKEVGRTLVRSEVDFEYLGLGSVRNRCVGRARLRMPDAGRSTNLSFELFHDVEGRNPGGTPTATSPALVLGDLAAEIEAPSDDGGGPTDGVLGPVEAGIESATSMIVKAGVGLGAAWLVVSNLDTIKNATTENG